MWRGAIRRGALHTSLAPAGRTFRKGAGLLIGAWLIRAKRQETNSVGTNGATPRRKARSRKGKNWGHRSPRSGTSISLFLRQVKYFRFFFVGQFRLPRLPRFDHLMGCRLASVLTKVALMRHSEHRPLVVLVTTLLLAGSAPAQKQLAQSPGIQNARCAFFKNQTGSDEVGKNAVAKLKKWGKFKLVDDPKQADVILLLSADPYKNGNIVFASGQTGSVDNGHVTEDPVPNYNKQSPTRYAYLTVIDPKTGDNLWSDSHQWGGLLTGFNSVGAQLVGELEKQTKR